MSNSSLATIKVPASTSNYTKGRSGRKIEYIAIHHMAGILSAEQCGNIFKQSNRGASTHYGVGKNGEIGQYVDETDTAWANSNWDSNCKSVTIETSNCEIGGSWKVSDVTLNSLIKLVADIAKRNNITLIKGKTLVWHRMYCATTCPGDYLISKLDYIISEANKINSGVNPQPTISTIKYQAYDNVKRYWLPNVVVGSNDYAGNFGNAISGVYCDKYKMRVHDMKKGYWLPWVQNRNDYAGNLGNPIDGIQVEGASYRAHLKNGEWLSWVNKVDDTPQGYAGIYGKEIDAIQIKG